MGDNGIEITSVLSTNKGLGIGSVMMMSVLSILTNEDFNEGQLNQIMLECVGSIGAGEGRVMSSISQQTKFFRKFGFRVVKDKKERGELVYVQMNYDEDKFNPQEVIDTLEKVVKNK